MDDDARDGRLAHRWVGLRTPRKRVMGRGKGRSWGRECIDVAGRGWMRTGGRGSHGAKIGGRSGHAATTLAASVGRTQILRHICAGFAASFSRGGRSGVQTASQPPHRVGSGWGQRGAQGNGRRGTREAARRRCERGKQARNRMLDCQIGRGYGAEGRFPLVCVRARGGAMGSSLRGTRGPALTSQPTERASSHRNSALYIAPRPLPPLLNASPSPQLPRLASQHP